MAPSIIDVGTARRLSISLLAASGALLFAGLNLIGAGVAAGDRAFAAGISEAVSPLSFTLSIGLIAFIMAEIAGNESTPDEGHPHSKRNYLQTVFALLVVAGLGGLIFSSFKLIAAATITL